MAFGGVVYGLVTIVQEGTEDSGDDTSPVATALDELQTASEDLAARLDALKPGDKPPKRQAKTALAAQRTAVDAGREGDLKPEVEDALNAQFDWLDALSTVIKNPGSRLVESLGDRGEKAIEAWEGVDDDHGIGATVRGVAALTRWADAQ